MMSNNSNNIFNQLRVITLAIVNDNKRSKFMIELSNRFRTESPFGKTLSGIVHRRPVVPIMTPIKIQTPI